LLILAAAVAPAFAAGPAWDSTGNSQLNGTYYFRQVLYETNTSGAITTAFSDYGNISFSGSGTYTVTSGTFVQFGGGVESLTGTAGTYSVSASGFGFMSSPVLSGANVEFLLSNGILVGSQTENGAIQGGFLNDMFVAAPYSTNISLSSFSGLYTVAAMFPGADATFQLNPNGGSLGSVSISGFSPSGSISPQNSSGVKYTFSNGAYSITFPTNNSAPFYQGGSITNTNGDSGPVFLYMSPDSNFVFGGSALGVDIFVGVRNVSSGTSTPLSGLYYEAGFDDIGGGLDSYYGTFNAYQNNLVGHKRILYAGNSTGTGVTYSGSYPAAISGTYTDPSSTVQYTIGQDGIRIGFGISATIDGTAFYYPSIEVGLPYSPPAPTGGVYVDPTGVVNTASSAPYTAGVSPGDFITLYNGVNLANSTVFAPPGAFPTSLGGVTVTIDSIFQATLYYVSPTQISFLVPFEASIFPIASIEVNNNGSTSTPVTTYVNLTTPGVFTYDTGIGDAALIDYPFGGGTPYFINENNPAQPGDTVVAFLTGLGAPLPANPDGALGVKDFLAQAISVDVNGVAAAAPAYAGLAPELAGLYQINFTVPNGPFCPSTTTACMNIGDNSIGIAGPDSYTFEATIPISEGTAAAVAGASPEAKPAARGKVLPRLGKSAAR
jgi:uncharacterized protein (TIGR03437 family)